MGKASAEVTVGGKKVRLDLDLTRLSEHGIFHAIQAHGAYELGTTKFLEGWLMPGDTFVDVGAHVGYFSCVAAALVGEQGKVFALEASFENAVVLGHNADLNKLANVWISIRAAGNGDGEADFWINRDNDGGNALWDVGLHDYNRQSRESPYKTRVLVSKLDSIIKEPVRAIKIDTEGAEHAVLLGAQELLKANPECAVICEINRFGLNQMGSSEQELVSMMRGLGYRCWVLWDGGEPVEMEEGKTVAETGAVFNVVFRKV